MYLSIWPPFLHPQAASCGLYSAAELEAAETTLDLPLRTSDEHPVLVHLDHRSMGVGGDNSWYPNVVHEEYTVSATRPYRFRFRMEALLPGEEASRAAAEACVCFDATA